MNTKPHLYICDIPAGSGVNFLGYLQHYYLGNVDYRAEEDFPKLNLWDDFIIDRKPFTPGFEYYGDKRVINIAGSDFAELTYPLKPCPGREQDAYNSFISIIDKEKSMYKYHQNQMSYEQRECILYLHYLPVDLCKQYPKVTRLFNLYCDKATHIFIAALKQIKVDKEYLDNPNEILNMAEKLYNYQELGANVPAVTTVDYSKLFIDVNKDEVKKLIINSLDIKEFNNNKLEPMCDMIKTYTKLNKDLINRFFGSTITQSLKYVGDQTMLEYELTDEFIYNNVTLYITTIPAGAGGSFLGYLQRYYMGLENFKYQHNPPSLNRWDTIAGHNLYNIFEKNIYGDIEVEALDTADELSNKFNEIFNERTLSKQTLFSANDLSDKFNEGLSYATRHTVRDIKLNGPFPVTKQGNYGILWHSHEFPYGIQEKFKNIRHILSVEPGDIDTHNYYDVLKSYKNGWNGKHRTNSGRIHTETIRQMLYDNKIKFNAEFPPSIAIDYRKFFFDVDKDEIKKFLVGTLDIIEFKNDKLVNICDMIKTYTKLNKELMNKVEYE